MYREEAPEGYHPCDSHKTTLSHTHQNKQKQHSLSTSSTAGCWAVAFSRPYFVRSKAP